MSKTRCPLLVVAAAMFAVMILSERKAHAEQRGEGFVFGGRHLELRLNLFMQPRYQYTNDDGTGNTVSTFRLNLAGGRVRVRMPRRRIAAQVTGGFSGDGGVLLDSFLEIGLGTDKVALRAGYFHVPFDEQTTHSPFWLRMIDRSVDVQALGHDYDLGIALRGGHLRDSRTGNALVWGLSMTNGEVPLWENGNIDFLYSFRLALRLQPILGWRRTDVIIGTGTSWTLEPWNPEPEDDPELEVNRSLFSETFDLTVRVQWFTLTGALLYQLSNPGAYGDNAHALGWHTEVGVFLAEIVEIGVRVAQIFPTLDDGDPQRLEAAVALNGFGDEGRMRFQIEYRYFLSQIADETDFDSHRVTVQFQAFY